MDYCLSYNEISTVQSLPSQVKKSQLKSHSNTIPIIAGGTNLTVNCSVNRRIHRGISGGGTNLTVNCSVNRRIHRGISGGGTGSLRKRLSAVVVASAEASRCEFSSLNIPLEPRSAVGKLLSGVLQNRRELFHGAVVEQLKQLADDRDKAIDRRVISSSGSADECLHRRIAEVEENERKIAIEDVMYMIIFDKFSEIRVHLVPKLSRCIYNNRLEIWPSRDWALESIHSYEVLEMVREHLTTVTGLRAKSSVKEEWATTQIPRVQIFQVYTASILYGYFLKSVCLRHRLEFSLALSHKHLLIGHKWSLPFPGLSHHGLKNLVLDGINDTLPMSLAQGSCRQGSDRRKLKCYVMGFDPDTLQRCAKPKSMEAINLIEKHAWALFGNGKACSVETDEVILTSFASLKRLVLEAVAFGSFLWDTEEYVDNLYKLEDN